MRPAADRSLLTITGVLVAALALVAGAISFTHMVELATRHGQHGWTAYAFPISVDGLELVASLYLLVQHRANRPSGPIPWIALIVGTLASLTANIAVGGHDLLGKIIAGWPALSLLIAIKLLFSMFDHHPDRPRTVPDEHHTPPRTPPRTPPPSPTPAAVPKIVPEIVPGVVPEPGPDHSSPSPAPPSQRLDTLRRHHDRDPGPADDREPTNREPSDRESLRDPDRATSSPEVADLIPAARAAHSILQEQGRRLARDALADAMRTAGHPVSNARASLLLKILHLETGHANRERQQAQRTRAPPQNAAGDAVPSTPRVRLPQGPTVRQTGQSRQRLADAMSPKTSRTPESATSPAGPTTPARPSGASSRRRNRRRGLTDGCRSGIPGHAVA